MSFGMYNYWAQQQQFIADNSRASRAPRVVVINERDPKKSTEKVVTWLVTHYPNCKVIQMAIVKQNHRIYTRVIFQTAQGQRKMILFDETASYLNREGGSTSLFPTGTVARLNPGTGSIPTRIQIVQH
ncbi:unnamed protein product [Adineta steineri]|uniref:Uncharacterized protein n=2 Tax=Adineta steineri TaxID=433720 RepID=A0A819YQW5_9BILA|nr:unnamed protein product [Adineta steineri]